MALVLRLSATLLVPTAQAKGFKDPWCVAILRPNYRHHNLEYRVTSSLLQFQCKLIVKKSVSVCICLAATAVRSWIPILSTLGNGSVTEELTSISAVTETVESAYQPSFMNLCC